MGLARQGSLDVHLWNKLLIKVLKPPVWCCVACDMWGCTFSADSSAYQLLQTWSMFLLLHLHGSLRSCNVIQKIRNQAPADLYVTSCLCGVYSPSCILPSSTAKSTGTCGKKWNPCNEKSPSNIGLDPSASVCLPFSGTTSCSSDPPVKEKKLNHCITYKKQRYTIINERDISALQKSFLTATTM